MNAYEILKNIHKVGHRISGVVLGHERFEIQGFVTYHVEVETDSKYKSILVYNSFDSDLQLIDSEIPQKGTVIEMVVKNFVDETKTLYLSSNPSDLNETEIRLYKEFYEVIENIKEGTILMGKINKVVPFGLFVDLENCPFIGLIDIGHLNFNNGKQLPIGFSSWIKEGDSIKCIVSYFRFHNRQIGLGWLPDETR
ncbi:S1 domain-containing protein [Arcicella rigui]|uniref:S1 motif domain-containing protein n=1 Tax=Arcicella rigui TaxID=797020 RepID=A0ABU5Q663_9BACT|nr:hypothetical protein [Arcicella rigui]MEA5137919.1 hypothetical protein [Arcicella rigui]